MMPVTGVPNEQLVQNCGKPKFLKSGTMLGLRSSKLRSIVPSGNLKNGVK